jgi:hypothetical protein
MNPLLWLPYVTPFLCVIKTFQKRLYRLFQHLFSHKSQIPLLLSYICKGIYQNILCIQHLAVWPGSRTLSPMHSLSYLVSLSAVLCCVVRCELCLLYGLCSFPLSDYRASLVNHNENSARFQNTACLDTPTHTNDCTHVLCMPHAKLLHAQPHTQHCRTVRYGAWHKRAAPRGQIMGTHECYTSVYVKPRKKR